VRHFKYHVHERRLKKIEALNPNIVVYAPTVEDIYEGKVLSQPFDFLVWSIKWKESSDLAILTV
jgi:hypothetical protein